MTTKAAITIPLMIVSSGSHAPYAGMTFMQSAGPLATGSVYIAGKKPQYLIAHLGAWCKRTVRGRTCSLHRKLPRRFCWIRIRKTPDRTNQRPVGMFI